MVDDLPADILKPSVQRFQALNEENGYSSDAQYFDCLWACESVRERIRSMNATTAREVYSTSHENGYAKPNSDFFNNGRNLKNALVELLEQLELKRVSMLAHTTNQPLIEAFLDKMEASEPERRLFCYVVVSACGGLAGLDSNDSINIYDDVHKAQVSSLEAFQRCDLSITDFLHITSLDSKWVKERIFEHCERPNASNLSAIANSTLRLFLGMELTSEKQYLEIESGCLQKTLLENPNFRKTDIGKSIMSEQGKLNSQDVTPDSASERDLNELANQLATDQFLSDGKLFRIIGEMQEQALATIEAAEKDSGGEGLEDFGIEDDLEEPHSVGPYKSELDYLEDQFRLIDLEVKLQKLSTNLTDEEFDDNENDPFGRPPRFYSDGRPKTKDEVQLQNAREAHKMDTKVRKLKERVMSRIRATKLQKKVLPRLEQLREALKLDHFEVFVILNLIRGTINPKPFDARRMAFSFGMDQNKVEDFISSFSSSLEVKMKCRRSFYKSSTLVKEGILTLSGSDFSSDLNRCVVSIDRRLTDYLCGVDMELSEIVDGSHLYSPNVNVDDVVLPTEQKNRILECALNYEAVKEKYLELEIDKNIICGLGQILLFHGSSGTGKTMMANAIAAKLKKKILLINFPSLGVNSAGDMIKLLFREARIKKAILFFDECESIFRSRDLGDSAVNTCLSELERFDDMCILATNRACDLDEAMFRRISLAVEFKKPDHILREQIWKTLRPEKLQVEGDVDYKELARKYELSGGFIKNVWLGAINLMVSRNGGSVSKADLEQAAGEQMVGTLKNEDLDRKVVPTCGIESVIASEEVTKSLKDIVDHRKAQSVLFSQWGFDKLHRSQSGVSALFHGPPGTGKSLAAEAISFDIGKPLMVVNAAELVNKYVGQTGKNIVSVFREAKQKEAVLVFDEGEGLFGARQVDGGSSVSRHDTLNVGLLLQSIENHSGVCIIITNHSSAIDEAFFRRLTYVLRFEQPGPRQREQLWRSIVPKDCPVASDVSYSKLSNRYEMSGGDIKSSLLRAASRAALRSDEKERIVRMEDLEQACQEEVTKRSTSGASTNIYL